MEAHVAALKCESNDQIVSRWEHNVWNEFSSPGNLKVDVVPTISITEQANKAACFTSTDSVIIDKARPLRECYKCDQCTDTMTSKQMLRQHKDSVHNDKKTFRCTVSNCVRAFTSANYLKNHIDIEHTDCSEARIPCPKKDCGLFFPNNYRLKRHIRQDHKQEKLYQCQICARKFASLEVRNNHTKTKHTGAPHSDNFAMKLLDSNFYRAEQNKESENDTVYAASPISSRFESLNGQSSIDTTCEAQWLTKSSDSNPPLSKQIDRILCDIFSDKYQERLHSPLSSTELAIAIVSLEETNEEGKRKQVKISPHLNSLISEGSSPHKSSHLFNELDKKMCTPYSRLMSNHGNFPSGVSQNNASMTGHNYPQSNTESESHSTESQRSFLVNSSQHEEFSDISMESHLKDVFSTAVDKWNVYGNVSNSLDNPIKLLEYTCLDTMFDDFHEIITSDTFNTHRYANGHLSGSGYLPNMSGQKNHLLSLNNMHSKFLGGAQYNNAEVHQASRPNNVPSNQITTLSNYEINRRKMNNCFQNTKIHHGQFEIASPYNSDPNIRDPSFAMEISSRCHENSMMNGPMFAQEGRMRPNYPQGYQYGSNQQLMGNNQMYHNREAPAIYVQQPDRTPYAVCLNGSSNSNPLYHNAMETEFINESLSQTNQYSNVFRRRAPPSYQAGNFSHQMLPSQHSSATAPVAYCPPSLHRNSCFHAHNGGLHADSSASLQQQQQQQRQQQRHLLCNTPIAAQSLGQQSNNNRPAAAIDNNATLECKDGIVCEEQFSLVTSNEQRSQTNPVQASAGPSRLCDISDAKAAICM